MFGELNYDSFLEFDRLVTRYCYCIKNGKSEVILIINYIFSVEKKIVCGTNNSIHVKI